MPTIRVKENEPVEIALRRFKRACEKAGILTEMRRREYYEKPTEERKRQAAAAVKRHFKRIMRENPSMMRGLRATTRANKRGSNRSGSYSNNSEKSGS